MLLLLLPLAAVASAARAASTRVVDADGTYDAGTNGCSGGDVAYTTIQSAVTASVDGDTILVCAGTYNETQILLNKALTVQSVSGAAATIIDGGGGTGLAVGGTVYITATTGNVTFDGFTVRNAKAGPGPNRFDIRVGAAAPVTITVTHNILQGLNNPADNRDYGLYAAGPNALDTLVFQYNQLRQHGSNPILIERHKGPTDVSYNTWDRGVATAGSSGYVNMSHSGDAITSLQKVSYNTIDLANDPGPYTSSNASTGISFIGALVGTSLGTFSNVEISHNTITNLRAFRRGIALNNSANSLANQALGDISNAMIFCNTITGFASPESGSVGVRLFGRTLNTTLHNNSIDGVDVGFRAEPRNGHVSSGAVLHENSFMNTGVFAVDWQSASALDLETNWWGSATGPTNAGNPGGSGGTVSATGSADFVPWLAGGSDADAGPCFVPEDLDQCHGVETCTAVGMCSAPNQPDATPCNDLDACTQTDACQSGICTGGNPVICTASDQCHDVGTCDTGSGLCSDPAKPNGAPCSDGDACTQTDTCQGGSCAGSNLVICAALDQCHDVGTCDTGSGLCSNPDKPDGTSCDDGVYCNGVDSCSAGACALNSGDPCLAGPECNNLCNESGHNCLVPSATACTDDGNVCTVDRCDGSGACEHPAGNAGTVCRNSADVCDVAETCDGSSAACPTDAFLPSTSVCRPLVGTCDVAETCTGSSAGCPVDVVLSSSTVCRPAAGSCDVAESCSGGSPLCPADGFQPSSLVCRAAASNCDTAESCTGSDASCPADAFLPDGTGCNVGDFCQAGVCQAPSSMVLSRGALRTNTGVNRLNGRATARAVINDNDTSGGLETALLAGSVTVRVRDINSFDVTRTLSPCRQARTRFICRSSDRKISAIFFTRPSGPYLYTMRLTLSGLGSGETGFVQPVGPVTVSLNQNTVTRTDVIGNLDPCTPRGVTRLNCREQ